MFFNHNLRFKRREKEKFLKDSYTKDELEKLYNDVYLYNLKQIYSIGYSRFIWRGIDELSVNDGTLIDDFNANDHNSYLKDIKSKEEFGMEILNTGFYTPIFINKLDDGSLMTTGGKHRICAIKILEYLGKWRTKKILTLENDNVVLTKMESTDENLPEKISNTILMRMPMCLFFTIEYNTIDKTFIEESLKSINGKIIDGDIVEFPLDNTSMCYRCLCLTGYWITEMFQKYRLTTGNVIESSPVINNIERFNEWIKQ